MTVDIARAAVITGDGIVARYPGVLCVARCPDRDALARLLDVCAGAAGPDPGRVLARRLAKWMGGPDAPGDDLEFGTVATTGDQLGVFLVGAAAVVVPGSPLALSGADAATWTDRLIPLPEVPVVLALDGLVPPAGFAHGINDLRAGVVPGVGAVLFPVGRPAPFRPEPDAGTGVDGPTVRTPAQAPRVGPRNGAPHHGPSRQPVNGSVAIGSDGDAAVDGPRARRQATRAPNGYEWFADWSDGTAPDGSAPGGVPHDAVSTTWPWADPPADLRLSAGSPAAVPPSSGAQETVAPDPSDQHPAAERTPVDEPHGRGWATETPTPPGGAPGWIDTADAEADRAGADQPGTGPVAVVDPLLEGRHAILGADGAPGPDPSGEAPIVRPGNGPLDVDQVHALIVDRGPAGEQRVPDDDATPVHAAPAVVAEPAPAAHEPEDAAEVVAPGPAPRPAPGPDPQEQTGPGDGAEPDPDEPLVHGRVCADGHLNDPRASSCLRCGAPVEDGAGVVGTRPPLGRIVFDDGAAFTVDAQYLVGRMPEADPRARSGELQSIVVEDRSGSVSRVHAEILIDGWDVVLVDSGSRNGTFVAGPDEEGWTPLAPGRTSLLRPGTRVRMGGRTFVFEPVPVS